MKKLTAALAGIVMVMLAASCQKEVEIDGDVDIAPAEYDYRLKAEGTVKIAESDGTIKMYDIKEGTIEWSAYTNANYRKYYLSFNAGSNIHYSDDAKIIKYDGKFYWNDVNDKNEVVVTNPESSAFTVTGSEIISGETVT